MLFKNARNQEGDASGHSPKSSCVLSFDLCLERRSGRACPQVNREQRASGVSFGLPQLSPQGPLGCSGLRPGCLPFLAVPWLNRSYHGSDGVHASGRSRKVRSSVGSPIGLSRSRRADRSESTTCWRARGPSGPSRRVHRVSHKGPRGSPAVGVA